MSVSPFFYLERYNFKTERYELMHPYVWDYNHTELIPADLYPYNGDHELFGLLTHRGEREARGVMDGLPKDVCDYIKEEYDNICQKDESISEYVHWISYADLIIDVLQHPKKDNPMKALLKRVENFLDIVDDFGSYEYQSASIIRIVYWII